MKKITALFLSFIICIISVGCVTRFNLPIISSNSSENSSNTSSDTSSEQDERSKESSESSSKPDAQKTKLNDSNLGFITVLPTINFKAGDYISKTDDGIFYYDKSENRIFVPRYIDDREIIDMFNVDLEEGVGSIINDLRERYYSIIREYLSPMLIGDVVGYRYVVEGRFYNTQGTSTYVAVENYIFRSKTVVFNFSFIARNKAELEKMRDNITTVIESVAFQPGYMPERISKRINTAKILNNEFGAYGKKGESMFNPQLRKIKEVVSIQIAQKIVEVMDKYLDGTININSAYFLVNNLYENVYESANEDKTYLAELTYFLLWEMYDRENSVVFNDRKIAEMRNNIAYIIGAPLREVVIAQPTQQDETNSPS